MANVLHSSLTGSDLHEVKGAAAASSDTVLIADGAGSADFESPAKASKVNAIGNVTTTLAVNISNGDIHTATLTDNVTTTTFSNPSSGTAFILILTQDGTGSRTVTWPASVKWAGGSAPTLSTGAGDIDILTFMTPDSGTTWYGFTGGLDFG